MEPDPTTHPTRLRGSNRVRQATGAISSWFEAHRTVRHLAALLLYGGVMLALFGPLILPSMNTKIMAGGNGNDGLIFVWALRWWPHAIGHLMNPLYTHDVWV